MSRAEKLPPLLDKVSARIGRPLTIVETGTIRNTEKQYLEGDGHSTLYIARWCVSKLPVVHVFYSIDMDIRVCKQYMEGLGLSGSVELVSSDSVTWLSAVPFNIDFAFLDSANDDTLILEEFKLVSTKLSRGGLIVVDDVVPNSNEIVKGRKLLPYLKDKKIKYRLDGRYCIVGE